MYIQLHVVTGSGLSVYIINVACRQIGRIWWFSRRKGCCLALVAQYACKHSNVCLLKQHPLSHENQSGLPDLSVCYICALKNTSLDRPAYCILYGCKFLLLWNIGGCVNVPVCSSVGNTEFNKPVHNQFQFNYLLLWIDECIFLKKQLCNSNMVVESSIHHWSPAILKGRQQQHTDTLNIFFATMDLCYLLCKWYISIWVQ